MIATDLSEEKNELHPHRENKESLASSVLLTKKGEHMQISTRLISWIMREIQ
jgi:hypothetical protein